MTGYRGTESLRSALAFTLSASLVLGGCVSAGPQDFSQNVAQGGPEKCNKITQDDVDTDTARTTAEGAAVWAGIGAVLGALLGVASGGNATQIGTAAAIGAGAGAVGGGVSGYGTAQQKNRYALQEARLNCQIEAAQEDNAKLDKLLSDLQSSIDYNVKQIDELQAEYNAKKVSADEAKAQLASIDSATSQMERTIAQLKERQLAYQTARDANNDAADKNLNTAELDKNIEDLNKKIAEADSALQVLVERRKVAQIG